jgi:hypothetical protein
VRAKISKKVCVLGAKTERNLLRKGMLVIRTHCCILCAGRIAPGPSAPRVFINNIGSLGVFGRNRFFAGVTMKLREPVMPRDIWDGDGDEAAGLCWVKKLDHALACKRWRPLDQYSDQRGVN